MSPPEIVALMRRHLVAVLVVCALSAGLGYRLLHANPGYTDTATVAFTLPGGQFGAGVSLLVTDQVMANYMMGADAQRHIRAAGGTASYDVALVNLNDEFFPDYGVPYVTVTTASPDPVAAQKTFTAVMSVITANLASRQAQLGVVPGNWIQALTISAATGPIQQGGSHKRSVIALGVLTLIAAYLVAVLLDRRQIQLPRRSRFRPEAGRRTRLGPSAFSRAE
jgi:hypothetical protein